MKLKHKNFRGKITLSGQLGLVEFDENGICDIPDNLVKFAQGKYPELTPLTKEDKDKISSLPSFVAAQSTDFFSKLKEDLSEEEIRMVRTCETEEAAMEFITSVVVVRAKSELSAIINDIYNQYKDAINTPDLLKNKNAVSNLNLSKADVDAVRGDEGIPISLSEFETNLKEKGYNHNTEYVRTVYDEILSNKGITGYKDGVAIVIQETDDEKEKREATDQINAYANLEELQKLCTDYPPKEWKKLSIEELKKYLIEKI